MRISDGRLGRFLSVDILTFKYPELTPYQFASNRPIDGVDLDGMEWIKRDNTNYRMDYKPFINAPGVLQKVNNGAHNVLGWIWNGTIGGMLESSKSINNYFAGGYKQSSGDIVGDFNNYTNDAIKYHTRTSLLKQLQDFGNAATDLENYEALPAMILLHEMFSPARISTNFAKLPTQEEIFTNSISSRANAESYAEMTTYKGYWNANDFIKVNNQAFDLISTAEKTVVDVATTDKANLKISTWEKTKLNRLVQKRPSGYSSILHIYVKEGKFSSMQLDSYKKALNDYIATENLQNVRAEVEEIPKRK